MEFPRQASERARSGRPVGLSRTLAAACWCALFLTLTARAFAQPTPTEPPAPERSTPAAPERPGGFREVGPVLYMFRDKDGNLVHQPDITAEKLQELLDLAKRLQPKPPDLVLNKLLLSGTVEGDHVLLEAAFEIHIRAAADRNGPFRAPLRLNNAYLRAPPQLADPARHLTVFERDGDGYVTWLTGEPNRTYTLTLPLSVPLAVVGDETRLALALPRNVNMSQLELTVPLPRASVQFADANYKADITHDNGRTKFRVLGVGGDFRVAWRQGAAAALETPRALQVASDIHVRIDTRRRIVSEAVLDVRNFAGPADSFLVRLPPQMKLSAQKPSDYSVRIVQDISLPNHDRQTIEVRVPAPVVEFPRVRLMANLTPPDTPQPIECGDFEIVDAVAHSGFVDFAVEGDWSLDWIVGTNVRRVETPPGAIVARFETLVQPGSLKMRILPRETRISVDPLYVVHVQAARASLVATLGCKLAGGKVRAIEALLPDWKIDLLVVNGKEQVLPLDQKSVVTLPLAEALPTGADQALLRIEAHRDLDRAETNVEFSLPQLRPSALSPEAVILQTLPLVVLAPDANVELTPRPDDLKGLLENRLPPKNEEVRQLLTRHPPPLVYQFRDETEPALFVADYAVRERTVTVSESATFDIAEKQLAVRQSLQYVVAYEPLRSIPLRLPAALANTETLKLFIEAPQTARRPLAWQPEQTEGAVTRVRVDLPEDRIGAFTVLATFVWPLPELDAVKSADIGVPLVHAVERSNHHELRVAHAETLRVTVGGQDWTPLPDAATDPMLVFVGRNDPATVPLSISSARSGGRRVTIERAWVQTAATSVGRRDRAVFRLLTAERLVRVRLPSAATTSELIVAVDGQRVADVARLDGGHVSVPLGGESVRRTAVVELVYWSTVRDPNYLMLDAPVVVGATPPQQTYWQLLVSRRSHLWDTSEGLAPVHEWRRNGLVWHRAPLLDQGDLERWVGAAPQPAVPGPTHQYVLAAFGSVDIVGVRLVSRRLVLAGTAGGVLVVGLLLIYFARLRHPTLLLLAGISLAAFAGYAPDAALLTGQAAMLGLAFVVLARVLDRLFVSSQQPVLHGRRFAGPDSTTQELIVARPEAGSNRVSATASGPARVLGGESKA